MVKMALKCDSAEQLGERLRRRYQRQQQRQGLASAGHARAEAELDKLFANDLTVEELWHIPGH